MDTENRLQGLRATSDVLEEAIKEIGRLTTALAAERALVEEAVPIVSMFMTFDLRGQVRAGLTKAQGNEFLVRWQKARKEGDHADRG